MVFSWAMLRLLVFSCLAFVTCRPGPRGGPLPPERTLVCRAAECTTGNDVDVTYLGVGGFMIQYGNEILLTAPHFTSPSIPEVALQTVGRGGPKIVPNHTLIRERLPKAAYGASAIVVGHGHYDHLLDVPLVADSLATNAVIYGSATVVNILKGDPNLGRQPRRLVAITGDSVGNQGRPGAWISIPGGAFRIMALESNHAPALRRWITDKPVDWAPGNVDTAFETLPERVWDWKVGPTYAYLIDVVDPTGQTIFRLYYQDTAASAPGGLPPQVVDPVRRVDVAILCVASARNARPESPDALVDSIRPRYVIAGHWENFFKPPSSTPDRILSANFREWAKSMKEHLPPDADWSTPNPMARYRFRAAP